MSLSNKPENKTLSFRARVWICVAVSLAVGVIGGWIAEYLTAPFYFGFFFAGVLTGMIGMFALAAYITEQQKRNSGR